MVGTIWGATPAERAASLPCDELTPGSVRLDRAISIDAPVSIVFAWLCQLRVAPYSYDLLDNTGRRGPRTRSAELTDLAVGQPFVRIFGLTYVFELAAFKTDEHITLQPRAGSLMSRFASGEQHLLRAPGRRRHPATRARAVQGPVAAGSDASAGQSDDDAQAADGSQEARRTRRAGGSLTG